MGGAIPSHCEMKHGRTLAEASMVEASIRMGKSIGMRNLVQEELRGLLERILLHSPEHKTTGLESVSIIQLEQSANRTEAPLLVLKMKNIESSHPHDMKQINNSPVEHRQD